MLAMGLEHNVFRCVKVPVEHRGATYTAIYFGVHYVSANRTRLGGIRIINRTLAP